VKEQTDSKSKVAVLGLGRMGAALASTLLQNGRSLVVWNRSVEKAGPLVDAGAALASSVSEAIGQCELIIVCVGSYEHTNAMLTGTEPLWRGKTLLQLSGGITEEAKALEKWTKQAKGIYLDGCILAFPDGIGSPKVSLMVTGNPSAWERHSELVLELGGASSFLGEDVSSHLLLEYAFVLPNLFTFLGVIQGAYLSEQAGFPVEDYLSSVTSKTFFEGLRGEARRLGDAIVKDDFTDSQVALKTYAASLSKRLVDFDRQGMSVDMVHAARALLGRAETAGYGGEGLSALIKLLRQGAKLDSNTTK
jgi:3-hydroxyisobutyrate dehydrogenase-like beta-hydroxyacid dehydrogenase